MTRRSVRGRRVAGLAVLLAGLGAAGAGAGSAAGHPVVPARLLVYAQEWSLWASRPVIAAGPVLVQLDNRGQDAHDLRVQALRHGHLVGRVQGVATTVSGGLSGAGWRLAPGTYELYCSLPGHAHAGMRTRLIVRR